MISCKSPHFLDKSSDTQPPSTNGSQPLEKQESVFQGKKYAVIQQKLTPKERIFDFLAIVLAVVAFPFTIVAYALSSHVRKDLDNLFSEFAKGVRQVKVLSEEILPPSSQGTRSIANEVINGKKPERGEKTELQRLSTNSIDSINKTQQASKVLSEQPVTEEVTRENLNEEKSERGEKIALQRLSANSIDSINKTEQASKVLSGQSVTGEVTRENLAEYMQKIISNYYGQPFPHRDKIKVEHNGQQVFWKDLTSKEKFDVVYKHSLPHNRPKLMTRDKFNSDKEWVSHIEDRLFRGGHNFDGSAHIPAGTEHDPRLSHGSDHGIRVGIFSAVYAALYNKYDPAINLTPEDLLVIQLTGTLHDSGRQTEGVDIDDARSAENVAQNFKKWEFSDKYIKEGAEAISGKDDQRLNKKSLIAKCVQCADSTEYGRVGFFNPKYLDIYKEFNGYEANPKESWNESIDKKPLKEGRTLEEFNQEIDAVNKEFAKIMHVTSQMRNILSQPGKNYYEEILKIINPTEYPRIHAMLTDLEIIKPPFVLVSSGQVKEAQKGAREPTIISPTLEKTGELFPGMLSEVEFVAHLGGSTGTEKVLDKQGIEYAKKTSGIQISSEHLKSEYHTNKAYKALGVKVPEVALYHAISSKRIKEGKEETADQPAMLSKFVPAGTIDLNEYLENLGLNTYYCNVEGVIISKEWLKQNSSAIKDIQDAAKKSFVADCLLANWDVTGLGFDNMRYDPVKKEMWRIDNGSGLDFRAQGEKKSSNAFTAHIQEFETFRNPQINSNTSLIFETITDDEIIAQIDDILPRRQAFLATIPNHLKDIMSKRFDYLNSYREKLIKN